MMDTSLVLVAMLALIGAMLSVAMIIAWRDFGRPPYALSWAAAFAAITLQWILTLAIFWFDLPGRPPGSPIQMLQLGTSALLAYGFAQRAGGARRGRWLAAGWAGAVTTALAFRFILPHRDLATLLPKMFSAAALLFAARVVAPRGRPATPGERGARLMLIAFALAEAALGLFGGMGGAVTDAATLALYRDVSWLVVPASFTGVGLFTVFLIAADLSARMQRLARTDPLTGLLNRRGLDDAIATLAPRWKRGHRRGCVVLADLDSFKKINDRHGHLVGDQVLQAFAALGRERMRRGELISRIGGEEFVMLLPGVEAAAAAVRLEGLRSATATMDLAALAGQSATASFGIAEMDPAIPTLVEGFADALARADVALMQAKGAGRNRVMLAKPIEGTGRTGSVSHP